MRAAIYARYSSDQQRAASIDDQIHLCTKHLDRLGADLTQSYADYALSGATLHRPGIQSLLHDCQSGAIDLVVAEALDRLSRDQEDVAGIFKRLTFHNVRLVTVAEGEINELHVGLKGTMNALFLKDLAQKTRRGQRGRVEAGKIPGGNSYGYKIVRTLTTDGSVTTGDRAIDEDQAAIVRRIFREYAAGMAPRTIAARLNREGVTGPRGGPWNASTINGSRSRRNGILNNELYLGRITYNRQHFVKDPETGKRISRLNPEHEWIRTQVPHLRIIDDETWNAVQAIKARYASPSGNQRQTRKRLLTGLVKCGACGGSMTIVNRERYYCSAKRERGTCDSTVGIKATELENRVLSGLKDILLGNEDLLEAFVREFKAETARLRKHCHSRKRRILKDLNHTDAAIKRCLKFITEGDGDPGLVRDELRTLEDRKRTLERDLDASDDTSVVEVHPNLPELYRRKIAELQTLLEDETTKPEAMTLIRSLIDRIEVYAGTERGYPDVFLDGDLARILAFTHQNKTAASGRDGGRVLMVAGACNHLKLLVSTIPLGSPFAV